MQEKVDKSRLQLKFSVRLSTKRAAAASVAVVVLLRFNWQFSCSVG